MNIKAEYNSKTHKAKHWEVKSIKLFECRWFSIVIQYKKYLKDSEIPILGIRESDLISKKSKKKNAK